MMNDPWNPTKLEVLLLALILALVAALIYYDKRLESCKQAQPIHINLTNYGTHYAANH